MGFELIPQKLIFGGAALGHYDGQPVLVRNVLPGERLEVEPLRRSRGMIQGRVRRVLSRSPQRVQPPCPYFGDCGGCSYQHISSENQIAWKLAILRETLRRIGKITWTSEIRVHSAFPWYYRNQARLKVGSRGEIGFFANDSHRLVNVDECRILSPCLNAVLAGLRQPAWRPMLDGVSEIAVIADDRDHRVMLTLAGTAVDRGGKRLARMIQAELPQVQTVALEVDGRMEIVGEPFLKYRVAGFSYQVSPGSFFQASRFLLPELVRRVTCLSAELAGTSAGNDVLIQEGADEATVAQKQRRLPLALDLYAGVGLFSLPLAQRFDRVMAVESHPCGAKDLAANVRSHGTESLRVFNETAVDFLRRFGGFAPDLMVLNPPRGGAGAQAVKLLVRLRPKEICYVSCYPPTLARDLSVLTNRGYAVASIEMFDSFPQASHIESITRLIVA